MRFTNSGRCGSNGRSRVAGRCRRTSPAAMPVERGSALRSSTASLLRSADLASSARPASPGHGAARARQPGHRHDPLVCFAGRNSPSVSRAQDGPAWSPPPTDPAPNIDLHSEGGPASDGAPSKCFEVSKAPAPSRIRSVRPCKIRRNTPPKTGHMIHIFELM